MLLLLSWNKRYKKVLFEQRQVRNFYENLPKLHLQTALS